jgi:hypothetical protein
MYTNIYYESRKDRHKHTGDKLGTEKVRKSETKNKKECRDTQTDRHRRIDTDGYKHSKVSLHVKYSVF